MRMEQNLVEIRPNFKLIRINRYLLHLDLGFWVKGLLKKYILSHRYLPVHNYLFRKKYRIKIKILKNKKD